MQLSRSAIAAIAVVGATFATLAGWFLFDQALHPSSTGEEFCALYATPGDEAPDHWTIVNITDEFLADWPLLSTAINEEGVRAGREEVIQPVKALEEMGATASGSDEGGYTVFGNYQEQVYRITGACAVS